MRSGPVWEAICQLCGKKASYDALWQDEAPTGTTPDCGSCLAPSSAVSWQKSIVKRVRGMVWIQKPEIPTHFNTGMGRMVYGRDHFEHLKKKLGVEDAEIGHCDKDGVPDCVPRDFQRTAKLGEELREQINAGRGFASDDEGLSLADETVLGGDE